MTAAALDRPRVVAREGLRASTDGQLVYAVGDIHGRYDLLRELLARLVEDAVGQARGRRPVLVFCGDYVDRGAQSKEVVQALVWLSRRSDFEARFLMGNHEQALLGFLEDPHASAEWLQFGGTETLRSYGVAPPEPADGPQARVQAQAALLDHMPASHLRFIQALETIVAVGDYAFVHAGIDPRRQLEAQSADDLLWIRRGFLDAEGPFEKVIVHGHTWTGDAPQILEHRLGVDTGAYRTGVLTAFRLDDGEVAVIQARA